MQVLGQFVAGAIFVQAGGPGFGHLGALASVAMKKLRQPAGDGQSALLAKSRLNPGATVAKVGRQGAEPRFAKCAVNLGQDMPDERIGAPWVGVVISQDFGDQ